MSSIDLASQTVQVTSEAKASPMRTAFTTVSALMNIPQGVRSRGRSEVPTTGGAAGPLPWAHPIAGYPATSRVTAGSQRLSGGRFTQRELPTSIERPAHIIGREYHTGIRPVNYLPP